MSRAEIVILDSSSPPLPLYEANVTPKSHQRVIPSTSTPDPLPSPPEPPKFHSCVDKRLKSGSRAVQVPTGTSLGFKSVSGLLKGGQLHSEVESGSTKEEAQNTTLAANPKLAMKELKAKDTARRNGSGKLKRPFKSIEIMTPETVDAWQSAGGSAEDTLNPGQNNGVDFQHDDCQVGSSPPKPRPSPMIQNGIKAATKFARKGKSKSSTTNDCKEFSDKSRPKRGLNSRKTVKPKKSTGKVSKHFIQARTSVPDCKSVQFAQLKVPHIEATSKETPDCTPRQGITDTIPAPKHRLDRTPLKNTNQNIKPQETASIDLKRVSLSPLSANLEFCGLMQNFARADACHETKSASKAAATRQTTKRKRIEIAEVTTSYTTIEQISPAAESKSRISKKRIRPKTITGCAIERFRKDEEQTASVDDTVSNFFGSRDKMSRSTSTLPTDTSQQNLKPRRSGKRTKTTGAGKAIKSTKTRAKATFVHPPLLNPEMAAQRISRQEEQHKFLFGTSSQLAMEKSPTMVRAIQQSLKEMEKGDSSGFIDVDTIVPNQDGAATKGYLWAVGSKIDDVSLLDELNKQDITLPQGGSLDQDNSPIVISQWSKLPLANEKKTDSAFDDTVAVKPNDDMHLAVKTNPSTDPHPQRPVTGRATANLEMSPLSVRTNSPAPSSTRTALQVLSANTSPQVFPRGRLSKFKADERVKTTASETIASDMQPPASSANTSRNFPLKRPDAHEGSTLEPTDSPLKRVFGAKSSSFLQKRPSHLPKAEREEISDSEAESNPTPSPPRRREQAGPGIKKAAGPELELVSSQEMAAIESSRTGKS